MDTFHSLRQESVIPVTARVDHERAWVELDPRLVELRPGQAIVWSFPGLRDGFQPSIEFESFTPASGVSAAADPALGPFDSLTPEPGRIVGSGHNHLAGHYEYWVWLVPVGPGEAPPVRLRCVGPEGRDLGAGGIDTEVEPPNPNPRLEPGRQ